MHLWTNRRQLMLYLGVPALVLAISGCASTAKLSPEADRLALEQRAKAYWNLIQANDRVPAWAFELASKDQSMTLDAYLKRGGVLYDAIEVRGVRSIDGDDAVADVWMRYSLPLLRIKTQEGVVQDAWRRVDGVWHHVQRRSSMFPDEKR
ncbi:hypothetical protein [Simplicispira piscis]